MDHSKKTSTTNCWYEDANYHLKPKALFTINHQL